MRLFRCWIGIRRKGKGFCTMEDGKERQLAVMRKWFGAGWNGDWTQETLDKCNELWWGMKPDKTPLPKEAKDAIDDQIRKEFGNDLQNVEKGKYDGWEETAIGSLALIILCDQMTRNVYRGSSKAFSLDWKAQAISKSGLSKNFHREFEPFHMRQFFYLPLMHSEDIQDHDTLEKLYEEDLGLANDNESERNLIVWVQKFAKGHREVIERFGRYPTRNKALGRESTMEEKEYLKTAESWGQ